MKKKWVIWLFILVFILNMGLVAAASDNLLEPILKTVQRLQIPQNYENFPYAADFIIYMIIFIGIAKTTIGKKFKNNGLVIGTGLFLSVALVSYSYSTGGAFSIRSFGIYAALVITIWFGIQLYKLIKEAGGASGTSAAIASVAVYFTMLVIAPNIFDWMDEKAQTLHSLIIIYVVIAFIYGVAGIIHGFKSGGTGLIKGVGNTIGDIGDAFRSGMGREPSDASKKAVFSTVKGEIDGLTTKVRTLGATGACPPAEKTAAVDELNRILTQITTNKLRLNRRYSTLLYELSRGISAL